MFRTGVLTALLLAGVSSPALAAAKNVSGIYGEIRMSRGTGDLGGVQVQIFDDPKNPRVEILECEGWCHCWSKANLRRDGDRFSFDVVEVSFFSGDPKQPHRQTIHYAGRFVGRELTLTGQSGADPAWPLGRLKRQKQRFLANDPLPECPR